MKGKLTIILLFIFYFHTSYSQVIENANNPWIISFGLSAVEDSGTKLGQPFEFKQNYHFTNPFLFSVEKRFWENYGLQIAANFNTFKEGKLVNAMTLEEEIDFFALDLFFKYYVTNRFVDKYRSPYEGYLLLGAGRSSYDGEFSENVNFGIGLTLFITRDIRFFAQAMAKFDLVESEIGSNYFQYDFGLIIRIPKRPNGRSIFGF
ncbi:hypothetical protein NBT05_03095 [Aquimarina sp. ERC-38]|uniref:hypothetical protein n=1 Tax=Aquimarina sp. ERC-38 TaxID=2949996 RepID=UPI002244FDE4|nr:hypothetical protein [Aquimarina sp. ERC-38]UZO81467.1 hypothetical protein NBT05_03095 [Aquimarina sp. ERC-38]